MSVFNMNKGHSSQPNNSVPLRLESKEEWLKDMQDEDSNSAEHCRTCHSNIRAPATMAQYMNRAIVTHSMEERRRTKIDNCNPALDDL